MPSLTVDRRAGRLVGYNIGWCEEKRRHNVFLSAKKYRRKTAVRLKEMIETLLFYRNNGMTLSEKSIAAWLSSLSPVLRAKLAQTGLIEIEKKRTCKDLWDSFLEQKSTVVKPSSMYMYQRNREIFFETFSPKEPVEKITVEQLLKWKSVLLARYAPASAAGYINVARMVFDWAVDQDWLTKNPVKHIPIGSFRNRENDRIVSREEYVKLLEACPNQEWRVIIALARIGGLRCPSEIKRLRWKDIDWERKMFLVRSSKTERFEGRGERGVPLFPELRTELERLQASLDETDDDEFVIQGFRYTSWNLGSGFQKIAGRAGLGTIVRPFDNMRMSRSNEVVREYGVVKERLWIGHSTLTMEKHYLCSLEEDFAAAVE